ncbi:MAG: DMT family transporter [Afipia birgiae]|nr:DMT family transporter [Afipia birgiae]
MVIGFGQDHALLGSLVGCLLWQHLICVMGATAASSYHFLMPPFGGLFGWLLIGEHVTVADVVGIVPVALGIYLVTRPSRIPCQGRVKQPSRRRSPQGLICLCCSRCPPTSWNRSIQGPLSGAAGHRHGT